MTTPAGDEVPRWPRAEVKPIVWRELIRLLDPEAAFQEPATPEQISAAEDALGVKFPDDLAAVLHESNGVADQWGTSIIWSCEHIVEQNREFRETEDFAELYMPFDHLLIFGCQVNSDHFAYAILRGIVRREGNIFIWDHETDSRTLWAYGMDRYVTQMLTGFESAYPIRRDTASNEWDIYVWHEETRTRTTWVYGMDQDATQTPASADSKDEGS